MITKYLFFLLLHSSIFIKCVLDSVVTLLLHLEDEAVTAHTVSWSVSSNTSKCTRKG